MVKKSFRFSLLSLFALLTIVALSISLYQARTRLASHEVEVDRLRKETGHLTIDDRTKVHVIAVPTTDAMTWRWRIYLPGGHDFGLYAHRGQLDARGLPESGVMAAQRRIGGQSNPRQHREILVDIALGKTVEGNAACLWISENGNDKLPLVFEKAGPSWGDGTKMFSERMAGQRAVVSAAVDAPIGLIALDGINSAGETSDDAVLIWISKWEKTASKSLKDKGILP